MVKIRYLFNKRYIKKIGISIIPIWAHGSAWYNKQKLLSFTCCRKEQSALKLGATDRSGVQIPLSP